MLHRVWESVERGRQRWGLPAVGVLAFLALGAGGSAIVSLQTDALEAHRKIEMISLGSLIQARLARELNGVVFLTGGLRSYLIGKNGRLDRTEVEGILKSLREEARYIRTFAVAVGGGALSARFGRRPLDLVRSFLDLLDGPGRIVAVAAQRRPYLVRHLREPVDDRHQIVAQAVGAGAGHADEEEKNDGAFAKRLIEDTASTVFVNDAFGTAHRAHASTEGVSHHVQTSVAGLLMEKELRYLGMALDAPEHPFVAILGGAKVSDKIQVIESLLPRVDALLIGGGMAYTFFRAQGLATAKSLVEEDKVELARGLLSKAQGKIKLPTDHVVAAEFKVDAASKTSPVTEIPEGWMGLDVGPATAKAFADAVLKAKLVLWNGPMGVFEMKPFAAGTLAVARALAESPGTTIVGGGDSVAAITQMGLADKITHVSTGGGASLEFLAGDPLPGVACLREA